MSESKVDFDELQKLTTEVRRAQSSLDAGVKGFSNSPTPQPTPTSITLGTTMGMPTSMINVSPTTTFGNTNAGATCLSSHHEARSTMDSGLKAFAATVDSDAERLEMAMSVYRKVDADTADNMLALNRNRLDILTTHLSNPGPHAAEQAAQIQKLRSLASDPSAGNMVVTGDFNAVATGDDPSAQGIRQFGGQGFDVNGGTINDGQGGTSLSHRPIDHVMPRGVGASEAQRWTRPPSDHDGQEVDVTMPNW